MTEPQSKPRIRHIALNVQNREELADYYKKIFGLEEKYRGPNGTIYLSDGFVGIALISRTDQPYGINHFDKRIVVPVETFDGVVCSVHTDSLRADPTSPVGGSSPDFCVEAEKAPRSLPHAA